MNEHMVLRGAAIGYLVKGWQNAFQARAVKQVLEVCNNAVQQQVRISCHYAFSRCNGVSCSQAAALKLHQLPHCRDQLLHTNLHSIEASNSTGAIETLYRLSAASTPSECTAGYLIWPTCQGAGSTKAGALHLCSWAHLKPHGCRKITRATLQYWLIAGRLTPAKGQQIVVSLCQTPALSLQEPVHSSQRLRTCWQRPLSPTHNA